VDDDLQTSPSQVQQSLELTFRDLRQGVGLFNGEEQACSQGPTALGQ
jgi:hypothetical protein